jgi:hypothetical protein
MCGHDHHAARFLAGAVAVGDHVAARLPVHRDRLGVRVIAGRLQLISGPVGGLAETRTGGMPRPEADQCAQIAFELLGGQRIHALLHRRVGHSPGHAFNDIENSSAPGYLPHAEAREVVGHGCGGVGGIDLDDQKPALVGHDPHVWMGSLERAAVLNDHAQPRSRCRRPRLFRSPPQHRVTQPDALGADESPDVRQ